RCRSVLAAARGLCLRRTSSGEALLDRRARCRRRQSAGTWSEQFRTIGGRPDRPLCHGVAALSSRMVQGTQQTRLWRRLAARLARNVELLRRGRKRAEDLRYPYRAHELNAAALVLAEGAEALGIAWAPTPLATVSAPRGHSPPCIYRGMCVIGCSTNAKQSVLIPWLPRALAAGAEIRDLAMVGRVEHDAQGRVTGVHYQREGRWRFQRARNVVVAGYAIETPRLL